MKKILVSIACLGVSALSVAEGQMPSFMREYYIGAGVTYPAGFTDSQQQNMTYTGTPAQVGSDSTANYSVSQKNIGGEIFAGLNFNQYLGFEGGFTYVGNVAYALNNLTVNGLGSTPVSVPATGNMTISNQWNLHLYGMFHLPITEWFLPYGFVGLGYFQDQVTNTLTTYDPTPGVVVDTATNKNNQFSLMAGAGLQFEFKQFALRGGYTYIQGSHSLNDVSNDNLPPSDYLSVDLMYKFSA